MISKEFRAIIKNAVKRAEANRDSYLTTHLALYETVKYYCSGKGLEEPVSSVFRNMSVDTKISLEEFCLKEYEKKSKKIRIPDEVPLPENYPMDLFNDSREDDGYEVTASDFLSNQLPSEDKVDYQDPSFFDKLYTRFGLHSDMFIDEERESKKREAMSWATDLINRIMGDAPSNNLLGDLKEKKLDFPGMAEALPWGGTKKDPGPESSSKSKTPYLDKYAVCMTDLARRGEYDPVIGRESEVLRVIEILCCKKKNNPALLGDPGCGKTSVVELLAQKLASDDVPDYIKGRKIYSLSATELTSGTTFRGQLEERVTEICKEVSENYPDIILYFDEFHQASKSSGDGIAELIKAPLGRGKLQMIMSTTNSEYRKFIEKDGALKRRFEPVSVGEPGISEMYQIISGSAPVYTKFHGVSYPDEVQKKIVDWSGRYITDRFFPDKAITIMDVTGSLAKLRNSKPSESHVLDLKKSETELNDKFIKAIEDSDFESAKSFRDSRDSVRQEIEKVSQVPVTLELVAEAISGATGIPVDKIMGTSLDKVKGIKESLETKVIGQSEAVREITVALQRNLLGLRDPKKPISSFLLVGPTGVGKSLIAKTVASEFFGSEANLISISCSEYMTEWGESKLLGAAPGYVGFSDTEPRLYELKKKPYSVLLIDEVEKSSKKLYNIWLNLLEEGEITLSSGEKVSAKNCIVIFTGNVGTKSLELEGNGIGFGSGEDSGQDKNRTDSIVMKEVRKEFRPEFLNRISKVVVFNSLGRPELERIFNLELSKLQGRLSETGITVTVDKKAVTWITGKAEPKYGARSLQRLIVTYVEQELCEYLLDTGKTSGDYLISLAGRKGKEKIEVKEINN